MVYLRLRPREFDFYFKIGTSMSVILSVFGLDATLTIINLTFFFFFSIFKCPTVSVISSYNAEIYLTCNL